MFNRLRPLAARLRQALTYRLALDLTTLLASFATVIALGLLIYDRRQQADIAAWTLLQTYLQANPRPRFNGGQNFALETLVQHGVDLFNLDGHDIVLDNANLHGLKGDGASFRKATLASVDLSGASLVRANFEGASIVLCECGGATFEYSNLTGASISGGTYLGVAFFGADISDLSFDVRPIDLAPDAFEHACYRTGHPPHLPKQIRLPSAPQGIYCGAINQKAWTPYP